MDKEALDAEALQREIQKQIDEMAEALTRAQIEEGLSRSEGYDNGEGFAREVRESLEEAGIDPEDEVDLAYYLYLPRSEAAEAAGKRLEALGLRCHVEEDDESGEWLCYAQHRLVPEADQLAQIGDAMLELAQIHEGEFDGWETVPEFGYNPFAEAPEYNESECEAAAKDIIESIRNNYGGEHRFVPAEWERFTELDRRAYDAVQHELERLGFRFVADLENRNLSEQGVIESVIRLMVHPLERTMVYLYEVPLLGRLFVEFDTELADGTFVVSSNALIADDGVAVEGIDSAFEDEEVRELYARHRRRLSGYETPAVGNETVEAFVAFWNEAIQRKYAALRRIGWISRERLLELSGGDEALADCIYRAIERLEETEA